MPAARAQIALAVSIGLLAGSSASSGPTPETILALALKNGQAHAKLAHLCDRFGHRISGSTALERAAAWAVEQFSRDGIEHAWTEPVMVPHWVRGQESGRITAPVNSRLFLLGLGGSVGTPPGGITAEVVEVDGFEQLEAAGTSVLGKIVLFNKAIGAGFDADPGYGNVVPLRGEGPSRAARLGAVAMLIRSLGTASFRLPHTGALTYLEGVPRIPSAAISAEDADLIHRLLAAGDTVRVRLELGAETLADAPSGNVLAELKGRELPDEIVLIGAHLDSWDVGQGAQDDGAGCAIVMETMRVLASLGTRPRRTVRAVLFTNEENGVRGGKDYNRRHGEERHVVAIESDSGGAHPLGFGVTAGAGALEQVQEIAKALGAVGADQVFPHGGGADISELKKRGVPVMSLVQDSTHYFDYHHTEADTLDKVDAQDLDRNVAALAVMVFALAEAPTTLTPSAPEPPPQP